MARRFAWFAAAFLVLCGTPMVFPGIDLWTTGLFYRAGSGFFLADWPPFRFSHENLHYLVTTLVVALAGIGVSALIRRRAVLGITGKAAAYLLLALALGPGLTVNTIFKDHWGRARPAQVTDFGGGKRFTRAFVPTDQCTRNCSFPAGDPAIGFYLASFALLAPTPQRRRLGIALAIAAGAALGIVRLAQGGHFLSDVVTSGFLVFAVSWALHRLVIVHNGLGALWNECRHPSVPTRQFLGLTLGTAALFALSYAFFDEPIARFFHGSDPLLHRIFVVITEFGEGGIYLIPLAVVTVASLWLRRVGLAWRTAYLFAAVAIPGLLADIVKPVFGRARPVLLFRDQLFGFTWQGPHADRWSFPSGHAITIVALATAAYAIYPPLWPVYALAAVLVAASRVIVDAHYLSDVIAGTYVGFVFAWGFALLAKRHGIRLSLNPPKITDSP